MAVVEPGRDAMRPGRRVALAAAAGVTVMGLLAVGLWRFGGDDGGSRGVAALASEQRPDVRSTTRRPTVAPAPVTTVPVTTVPVTEQGPAEPAATVPADTGAAPPAPVASVEGVQVGVSADAPVEAPPVDRAVVVRTFYLAPTWAQVLFTVEGPEIPEIARNMTQLVYALQGPDGVWRVTSTHLSSFVDLALPFFPPA